MTKDTQTECSCHCHCGVERNYCFCGEGIFQISCKHCTQTDIREQLEIIMLDVNISKYDKYVDNTDEIIDQIMALFSQREEEYKRMIEGLRMEEDHSLERLLINNGIYAQEGYNQAVYELNEKIDKVLKELKS